MRMFSLIAQFAQACGSLSARVKTCGRGAEAGDGTVCDGSEGTWSFLVWLRARGHQNKQIQTGIGRIKSDMQHLFSEFSPNDDGFIGFSMLSLALPVAGTFGASSETDRVRKMQAVNSNHHPKKIQQPITFTYLYPSYPFLLSVMPAMQVKGHVIVRTWLELEYVGMVGPARPGIKLSEDGQLDVQDVDQQRSVVLVGWIGSPWTKPSGKAVGRATKKRCLSQGTFLHMKGSSGEICPGLRCGMRVWICMDITTKVENHRQLQQMDADGGWEHGWELFTKPAPAAPNLSGHTDDESLAWYLIHAPTFLGLSA